MELDIKKIELIIERDEDKKCILHIPDLNNTNINLSDSSTNDIEEFFNNIFEWIVENKIMIEFFTNDKEKDLYNEVVSELIIQLNQEIVQSESIFEEIINVL